MLGANRLMERTWASWANSGRDAFLAVSGICGLTLALYLGRDWLVEVRGIWTEGALGRGSAGVDRGESTWVLLGSIATVLVSTVVFTLTAIAGARWAWLRVGWWRHSNRPETSAGHRALVAVGAMGLTLSLVMLWLGVGITLPIAQPSYPLRLETLLYFVRLGVVPVVLAVVVARSRLSPTVLYLLVLGVAVIASATSASRAVALAYALVALAVPWRRSWPRLAALLVSSVIAVNVATRARTLLIPFVLDSQELRDIYVSQESIRAATDVSIREAVGSNIVDLAGRRALGFDELDLALAFSYPRVSYEQGIIGVGRALGFRFEQVPQCPQLAEVFADADDRIGGINLDPLGRLWQASCGNSGAYLTSLLVVSAMFSLLILGAMALRVRWGHRSTIPVVILLGYLLWYDSRYTVLRFSLLVLWFAVIFDRRFVVRAQSP